MAARRWWRGRGDGGVAMQIGKKRGGSSSTSERNRKRASAVTEFTIRENNTGMYTNWPLYQAHLFQRTIMQISNQPIAWQQLDAFWSVDMKYERKVI